MTANRAPYDVPRRHGTRERDDPEFDFFAPQPQPGPQQGPGRRRKHRRHPHSLVRRILARLTLLACLFLMVGAVASGFLYLDLDGNIGTDDLDGKLSRNRPAQAIDAEGHYPLNVLVIGSDSRAGANIVGGGRSVIGQRSDVLMLVHVAASREWAVAMSIPRDTLAPRPECVTETGGWMPPVSSEQINSAFEHGPACTRNTVEALTGIRIDHHVVVDFSGFQQLVDAIGTVRVCLPKAVRDEKSHLDLPAGPSEVDGKTALAFVRMRHDHDLPGDDGSDLGRIKRQQQFLSGVITRLQSRDVLLDPAKLYRVAQAATGSISTDPGLNSVARLSQLALTLKSIPSDRIGFITAPWVYSTHQPGKVELTSDAQALFTALASDLPLDGIADAGTDGPAEDQDDVRTDAEQASADYALPAPGAVFADDPDGAPSVIPSARPAIPGVPGATGDYVPPSDVRVQVRNATGTAGTALNLTQQLMAQKWHVVRPVSAPVTEQTTVTYRPGQEEAARVLAAAADGATLQPAGPANAGADGDTLVLTLGRAYRSQPTDTAEASSPSAPTATTPGARTPDNPPLAKSPIRLDRTADQDVCTPS